MNNATPKLEPTEYAAPPTSHYETTVKDELDIFPYEGMTPVPPPPPRRRIGVTSIILATAVILGLFAGAFYFAVSHYSGSPPIYAGKNGNITNQPPISPVAMTPVPTPVPTQVISTRTVPTPTATPITVAPYSAIDMYQHFNDAGIQMGFYSVDQSWCQGWNCPWIPSGGAVFWKAIEETGEPTVEVATFLHHQPAVDDASVFTSNGNWDWTYGNCLLILYSDNTSSLPDLQSYLNVMQQFCK